MSTEKNNSIGVLKILLVIFVVLKLTGLIEWSWFWVLSPIIFYIPVYILILLTAAIFGIIRDKIEK